MALPGFTWCPRCWTELFAATAKGLTQCPECGAPRQPDPVVEPRPYEVGTLPEDRLVVREDGVRVTRQWGGGLWQLPVAGAVLAFVLVGFGILGGGLAGPEARLASLLAGAILLPLLWPLTAQQMNSTVLVARGNSVTKDVGPVFVPIWGGKKHFDDVERLICVSSGAELDRDAYYMVCAVQRGKDVCTLARFDRLPEALALIETLRPGSVPPYEPALGSRGDGPS